MFYQRVEDCPVKSKLYLVIMLILLFLLPPLALSQGDSITQQPRQAKPQKKEKTRKQRLPVLLYVPYSLPQENLYPQEGELDLSLDFLYDYSEFFEYNRYFSYYRTTQQVTLKSWNLLFGGPARPFAGTPIGDGLFLPVYSLNRDPVLRKFWWDW